MLLERKKSQQDELQNVRKKLEQVTSEEEGKIMKSADANFPKYTAIYEDKLNEYLISTYQNIVSSINTSATSVFWSNNQKERYSTQTRR